LREQWRKRLPRLLVIAALLLVVVVIGAFVFQKTRGQTEQALVVTAPSPQATFVASATPAQAAAMPAVTLEPTTTSIPATIAAMPALSTEPAQAPTPTTSQNSQGFDVSTLQRLMLDLINNDRKANGLGAVAWDDSAARAAMSHAEDMAAQGYFSHWNTKGWGPDVRYGLAGGTDVIGENVAAQWRRYDDGRPAPIDDWSQVIHEAQTGLMNSPGHRANILDPHHTHVGIGIAYNAQTGETRIAQEFINRYVILEPVSEDTHNEIVLRGTVLEEANEPMINVAFEPMPQPLTPDDLNNRMPRTYSSPAETVDALKLDLQAGGRFVARVPLGQKGAGLYHIRIWITLGSKQVPASDVIVPISSR